MGRTPVSQIQILQQPDLSSMVDIQLSQIRADSLEYRQREATLTRARRERELEAEIKRRQEVHSALLQKCRANPGYGPEQLRTKADADQAARDRGATRISLSCGCVFDRISSVWSECSEHKREWCYSDAMLEARKS